MTGPEARLAKREPSPGRAGCSIGWEFERRRRGTHVQRNGMMPRFGGPKHVSHSYTNNHVHVVYSTYNRQDLIPPGFEKRLYSFIAEIGREH